MFPTGRRRAPSAPATAGRWFSPAKECKNGLANDVTFNFSNVKLPETVVYEISYNTNNHGPNPLGVASPVRLAERRDHRRAERRYVDRHDHLDRRRRRTLASATTRPPCSSRQATGAELAPGTTRRGLLLAGPCVQPSRLRRNRQPRSPTARASTGRVRPAERRPERETSASDGFALAREGPDTSAPPPQDGARGGEKRLRDSFAVRAAGEPLDCFVCP